MGVRGMNHLTIRPGDLDRTARFYADVLGLRIGDRPPFGFPGVWLWNDEAPIVHLIGDRPGEAPNEQRPAENTGRLDHVAFACADLPAMRDTLTARGIAFQERVVPRLNQTQLFLSDPDGVPLELIFPGG
jgi:catechol 2,3-dioxygenase-like lactoylglutathione lyase family enzyme